MESTNQDPFFIIEMRIELLVSEYSSKPFWANPSVVIMSEVKEVSSDVPSNSLFSKPLWCSVEDSSSDDDSSDWTWTSEDEKLEQQSNQVAFRVRKSSGKGIFTQKHVRAVSANLGFK